VNIGWKGNTADLLEFWRGVEADDATWLVATRTIADDRTSSPDDALIDETRRLFRAYPARRGALLYVLAQIDRYSNGRVPWTELAKSYGAAVDAAAFSDFLDQGSRAVSLSPVVWPALGPGFSRTAPLVQRLDRYMDDPHVRDFDFQDPWRALREIVHRVCADGRRDDLRLLHDAFAARAQRKPSEARPFQNLVEDTRPGACR
jgi:hypothetical protein